ncbi:hypothetical protein EWM64_g953 [Hericium alpestre]|uniref:Myb-like domain-containing protein n=1 Tax=Hericium alpestre TaxID=135208 RepID=A0A4Z0AAR0_9AGAM|nr:hypothetical protein EWM64_g953 [Hericium alpestre]
MATLATQNSLPSDIQLALQHAVGQANGAYTNLEEQGSKKKKSKKRAREEDGSGERGEELDEHAQEKKKRKKDKKKARAEHNVDPDASVASVDDTPAHAPPETERPKKKKSKKDKGKQREADDVPAADDTGSTADSQAQSAAFINAVVSAASATAGLSGEHAYGQPDFSMYPSQSPPYMPLGFPGPSGYPYGQPPLTHPPQHPPVSFPGAVNHLPPELLYGSNDDVARALQDLDLTKIAGVLKTIGEAAAAANIPYSGLPSMVPPPPPSAPNAHHAGQPSNGHPASASLPRKQPRLPPPARRITNIHLPAPDASENSEHAHMLATRWMSAGKLAELAKTEGLKYKKGKFSTIEEQQVINALETYRAQHGLAEDQLQELIFAKDTQAKNMFWSEITSAVHLRPIIAVYHYVRRRYHPMQARGKWMPTEDDNLVQAVAELGQQWEKVSSRVGRRAGDCRDRWRNHLEHRAANVSGPWTKQEEDMLTQIVTEMTIDQGKDMDSDVFWGVVSQRMGNTRGRQQCRIKWTDSLSKLFKNQGLKPRWSPQDGFILVHKVESLHVRDDSEIDWKTLPDQNWNLWSPHTLQRRWLTMKRSIKGHEEMSHEEIMDILLVKKAHLPPQSTRRKQKIVSAEAVEDSDEDLGDAAPATRVVAEPGTADAGSQNNDSSSDSASSSSSDDD